MPRVEKIPINALIEMSCAWKGCKRTVVASDVLPADWKCIVVAPGSLFKAENLMNADVDGVLCPEHFAELQSLLKIGK